MVATTICLYIMGVAVFLCIMHMYMWLSTWSLRDRAGGVAFVGQIIPLVCLGMIPLIAAELGIEITDTTKQITFIITCVLCIASIVIAAINSIVGYCDEGYAPDCVGFVYACAYSITLAAFTYAFLL